LNYAPMTSYIISPDFAAIPPMICAKIPQHYKKSSGNIILI